MHRCKQANKQIHQVYIYIHTYSTYSYVYIYVHVYTHNDIHTHIHTYMHTHVHTYIHTCINTYIYMYMYTQVIKNTHIHILYVYIYIYCCYSFICIPHSCILETWYSCLTHVSGYDCAAGYANWERQVKLLARVSGTLTGTHGRGPLHLGSWGALGSHRESVRSPYLWVPLIRGALEDSLKRLTLEARKLERDRPPTGRATATRTHHRFYEAFSVDF